jgi:hypothetical protein
MSGRHQIYPALDWICLVNQDNKQRKSRSGTKMMNLGSNKIMISK